MKLFELGWTWHEESTSYLFIHPHKTDEEFKEDIHFLLRKYGNEYIENEECYVSADNWITYIVDKMSELGYEKVETTWWKHFGSFVINGESDEDEKWRKIVGDELMDIAITRNKKINDDGGWPDW
jgi:hypothetical protein